MNPTLFLTLMVALAITNLWIGKRAAKTTKTEDDFFLSGRNLGIGTLVLTILATQLGGGVILGAAEEAYQRGWMVLFYPLGSCLGLGLVALGFGAKVREMELSTIPELLERIYGSKNLRHIASAISITSLFIILVAQGIAARKFFIAIGYTDSWIFISFWLILVLYTVMGGLTAVVNTDILQVLFMIGAFGFAFLFTCFSGVETTSVTLSEISFDQTDVPWVGWLLMPLLYMFIEQDMAQRFFSAKTPRLVTVSAYIAAGTLFISTLIPIYFGVKAAEFGVVIPEGASVLLTSVEVFTNPFILTFVTVAILMAIVSTADTLLCSISSNVAYDFKFFHHKKVLWAQSITFTIGMISLATLYLFGNVISVLIFSYELSVSVLFVPVIMAVFGNNPTKQGAILSMIGGTTGFIVFKLYPVPIPRELITLALAFGGYFLGNAIGVKSLNMRGQTCEGKGQT